VCLARSGVIDVEQSPIECAFSGDLWVDFSLALELATSGCALGTS